MPIDHYELQRWLAGQEYEWQARIAPFARVPLLRRLLGKWELQSRCTERVDVTRVRDLRMRDHGDSFAPSIDVDVIGFRRRFGLGDGIRIVLATFQYTDDKGGQHVVRGTFAYEESGILTKERVLRRLVLEKER